MKYIWIPALIGGASLYAQNPTTSPDIVLLPATDAALHGQLDAGAGRDYRNAIGLSLYWENDGAFTDPIESSDQWYTSGSGIAVQWQSPGTTEMLSHLPSIGDEFGPDRAGVSYAGGLLFSLNIYTPKHISQATIQPNDRPYAGWTYGAFIAQRADRAADTPVFEHWEIDAGAMGPMSRAGDVQKWVHSHIDGDYPRGWEYQVRDEVGVDLKYQRRWRFDISRSERKTGPGLQLIPDAGVTIGTIHTNISAGATLRFGWNLPDDFGPGSMRYAADFTRPLGRNDGLDRGISGYLFVRPGGRIVLHDATFGDSLFRDDNPVVVDTKPFVGEISTGAVMMFFRHWRLSWTHTFVTPEFDGQGEWHSYASLNLSMVHTW